MNRNYNDPQYEQFRKDVLNRDSFICQMPNCKRKKPLHVHHIKQWSKAYAMRFDVSNGITLCKYCHKEITGKEHHYEHLFREIVDGKTI